MEPFRLHPYVKPPRVEGWVPEEQVPVSFTLSRARFDKFRRAGRKYGLSMRQVLNQMLSYAEAHMEQDR